MKTSRRDFLKIAAGATAAGAAGAGLVKAAEASVSSEEAFAPDVMAKFYDSSLCIGCQSCVYACYRTNFAERAEYVDRYLPPEEQNFIQREDLIPKVTPEDEPSPEYPWLKVVTTDYRLRTVIQKYEDENKKAHFIKHNCMHCKHPGCVSACPVTALTKNPKDGVVEYDSNKCIGCRYCQMACPFNIPKFEWHRAVPKIVKCDMCRSTLGKNNLPGTACVNACPTGAVIYGKRSDNLAEAKRRIAANPGKYYNDEVFGEKIYGGTDELFLAEVDYNKLGFPTEKIGNEPYALKSEGLQHTIYKWGIAPVALYAALAVIGYKNAKKHHDKGDEKGDK